MKVRSMNLDKLKQAEEAFFSLYPGGFNHPEMVALGKKHKMDKMITFAQEGFSKGNFKTSETIIETMIKVISRSSMVSVFEKPKFKDFTVSLSPRDQEVLASGLEQLLHGKEKQGFERIVDVLKEGKLAKWSLATICQAYFRPKIEVFVKPTTAKGVIEVFELKSLQYKPAPTRAFYEEYRRVINEMKSKFDSSLAPNKGLRKNKSTILKSIFRLYLTASQSQTPQNSSLFLRVCSIGAIKSNLSLNTKVVF